jgi:hypothetical protein
MSLANELTHINDAPGGGFGGGGGFGAPAVNNSGVYVFCLTPAGVGRFDPSKMPPPPAPKPGEPEPPKMDLSMFGMPGFNGMIPPEAGGAAMVYSLLHAKELHGSGFIINDAFNAMKFPYPNQATAPKAPPPGTPAQHRLSDMELTLAFCTMGPGFAS